MSLKYCYNKEIHKTFTPPATFQGLIDDIRTVFESKLPNKFSVQYKDNDQDLITISSDSEYNSMLKFEAPKNIASIRLFIVPTNRSPDDKEISFEVIDTSHSSLKEGGISEISLSSSRSESALSRGSSSSPKRKHGSHSFDATNNCGIPEQKMHVSYLEPYVNQTFSQQSETEGMVLQSLQDDTVKRNDRYEMSKGEEAADEQNIGDDQSMASQPDSLYAAIQGDAHNLENMIFTNEIEKVTQELAAKNTPKMLEKLRTSNNYEESLLNQFLYPHDNFHNISNIPQGNNNNTLSFDLKDHFDEAREVNIASQNQNNMQVYESQMEPTNNNRYLTPFNPKRRLWLDEIEEPNQDYPSETFPQFRYNKDPNPAKHREWTRFPTQRKIVNCDNYQKPKPSTYYQPPTTSYEKQGEDLDVFRYRPELSRNNQRQTKNTPACEPYYKQDKILMENQGYEVTTGLSSRLFSIGDSEGHRVVYKTVFIKNTGTKPWTRCFVKSVGLIAGKTVELCNIGVGQTAVVTLELTGYFTSRTYTSRWKLVHENQYGMVEVIGGPFDVEFTINSNIITADKVKMNTCEQSFEDLRVDYGRQDFAKEGYRYEDFASEDEKRSEEDQEVDQTFARYFRQEEEEEQQGEDYEAGNSIHWFSQQDLYPVRNFANNNDSIDEYYLN